MAYSTSSLVRIFVGILLLYSVVTLLAYNAISDNGGGRGGANTASAAAVTSSDAAAGEQQEYVPPETTTNQDQMRALLLLRGGEGEEGERDLKSLRRRLQHTFPIHVRDDDREIIPHPGLVVAQELHNVIPSDLVRPPGGSVLNMTVPAFFDDTVYANAYGGSVRRYLGNFGKRLPTIEEAMSVGSFDSQGHETIYCSIASYRDFECRPTVIDLYERAKYPERIRVAVLDQRVEDDDHCIGPPANVTCDEDPEQVMCKYRHLIDVFEMDARLGIGPVFARHLANRHYRGEYFTMQVDSHVRFTEHWDEDLIQQWKSTNNEMGVLTTYLSDITNRIDPVTHHSLYHLRPIMCESDYEGKGARRHLRHGQQPEGKAVVSGEPMLHPFWAAGFSFARGHFVVQVPYDQYLPMIFQGEEISLGLRGFTYGYDYYTPEHSVLFHMYQSRDVSGKRKTVPHFWENARTYMDVGLKAMKRLNSIIGMAHHPDDEWQHDEIDKYGMGNVRDPSKFFKTFGIHTDTQTVEHHLCQFVAGRKMMTAFLPALRENRMGIDYDKIDFQWKDPNPKVKKN